MSATSSRNKPLLIGAVAVLLIAAIVFGITRMGGSSEEGEDGEASGNSAKSSRRPSGNQTGDSRYGAKSAGKTEEERLAGVGSALDYANLTDYFTKLSMAARVELAELRKQYATEFDDPEKRRAFGVELGKIKDPQGRAKLLRERTEEMRLAREEMDAAKTPETRAREARLLKEMQLLNLQRMAAGVVKNPDLTAEAEAFSKELAGFADGSRGLDDATFTQEFAKFQQQINALRARNIANQGPVPGPTVPGE